MQIATWNVNSVRARLPRVLDWLAQHSPEVVCLQETKCLDAQFPAEPIEELGYQIAHFGQKSYNGVALLSRIGIEDVWRGMSGDGSDGEARVIGAQIADFLVLNVYVVNGQAVGAPKYHYKLEWLAHLRDLIRERYDLNEKVVVTGDFNVTFDDRDVYDPEAWREQILCSTPEREALSSLTQLGLVDALREFHTGGELYTWWDFRTRGFSRNRGLRIDHFLLSEPALRVCTDVVIDVEERGRDKPSDHAPVVAVFR